MRVVFGALAGALDLAKRKLPLTFFLDDGSKKSRDEKRTGVESRCHRRGNVSSTSSSSSTSSFVDEIIANSEKNARKKEDKKRDVLVSFEEEISVLTNWSFDAFQYVKNASKEKEDFPLARLFMTAFDILAKGGIGESKREEMKELFALINREKLFVFAQNVELGYADVETLSYHNVAHACEVVHATFAILTDVITEDKVMDPLSVLSLLIAAIGHDIYHPGCDNTTLAKERVDIKRRYNGQSLAEMLSCEVVLELLRRSGALSGDGEDDVSGLTTSQIAYIEDVVATSILSTDLLKHEENPNKAAAATAAQIVLKSADLAHFARPREIHLKWVRAAMDEQKQDTKREVQNDGGVNWKNQVLFAETFVLPTLAKLCENVSVGSTPMYEFAKTNVEESRQLIEAF